MHSTFFRLFAAIFIALFTFGSFDVSSALAFSKISLSQTSSKQLYNQEVIRFEKLYTETKITLPNGNFSPAQRKKIRLLEQSIVRSIKTLDIAKTSKQKLDAQKNYNKSISTLQKYLTTLSTKTVRTPNIRTPNTSTSGGNTDNESLVIQAPEVRLPDPWSPDQNAKILYYSDAFEGGGTSNGDEFSQSVYSAANCSASLNQLIQVRSGEEAIVVKVNDRPTCSKHPDIVDLSKIAFSELGRLQSGTLQGSFKKLGMVSAEFTKSYLPTNAFEDLGIKLDVNIPNSYLPNDTFAITGDILNGGSESLIYLVAPSGKIVSFGQDSFARGKFDFRLPLTEVGKYDLVVASGRSFQSARPVSIFVVNPDVLAGKSHFLDNSFVSSAKIVSTLRREAADLSPTHLITVNTGASENLADISISANGKKWKRSGFGLLAFDPLEFKGIPTGTEAIIELSSSKSSTYFSMDTITPRKTHFKEQYTLAPNYGITKEVDYTSKLSNGTYTFKLTGASSLPIHSTVYIMTPAGRVDTVDFNKNFISGNTLHTNVGASFEYTMNEPGVYLVEVNFNNGFAAVIEPVVVGKTLAILPNEYDVQSKEIETNLAFARNQILKDINNIRARAGLSPVAFDSNMQQIADVKADDMATNTYVGHKDSRGDYALGLAGRLGIDINGSIGENVAGGTVGAQYLQAGLSLSPGHRLNMLGEKWNKVGISLMVQGNRVYVVQIFGE